LTPGKYRAGKNRPSFVCPDFGQQRESCQRKIFFLVCSLLYRALGDFGFIAFSAKNVPKKLVLTDFPMFF
jgi:hypothetical protein